jgi:phosphatidylserine synthase
LANIVLYEHWLSTSIFHAVLKPEGMAFVVTIIALLMISSLKFPSNKYVKMHLATGSIAIISIILGGWLLIKGYPLFLIIAALYIGISFTVNIFREITRSWWQ